MPTAVQLYNQFVGRKGLLTVLAYAEYTRKDDDDKLITYPATCGVQVAVKILDARVNFGNPQCLVQPLRGVGTTWVSSGEDSKLVIVEDWPDENEADEPGPVAHDTVGSGAQATPEDDG